MRDEEDPRAQGSNICRVTFIGATGIEWICIREVHDKAYFRKQGSRRGELIVGSGGSSRYAPQADRHEFVNRWPNRPTGEDASPPTQLYEGDFDGHFQQALSGLRSSR